MILLPQRSSGVPPEEDATKGIPHTATSYTASEEFSIIEGITARRLPLSRYLSASYCCSSVRISILVGQSAVSALMYSTISCSGRAVRRAPGLPG